MLRVLCRSTFTTLPLLFTLTAAWAADAPRTYPNSGGRLVWDRVRFESMKGHEQGMVGGRFAGSNVSATEGYEILGEIKDAPKAGEFTELSFDGRRPHRWIRYEAPPGSYGRIAKIEFYAGKRRLGGSGFGSIGHAQGGRSWAQAINPKPGGGFESDKPDGQYVGIDTLDFATAVRPKLDPEPANFDQSLEVTITCPTPAATIRYTLDGTTPDAKNGLPYTGPIQVGRTTTIAAAALKEGFAVSPPASGTYLVGPPRQPKLTTFHIGNSITQSTNEFAKFARTAGYDHSYVRFVKPGIWTNALWEKFAGIHDKEWEEVFGGLTKIDHFTVQPRDFNVAEEAEYERKFFDLVRKKSPDVQPWLYAEWTDLYRSKPTDAGMAPNPCSQMRQLAASLTWEESAAAMLLYVEEVQRAVLEQYPAGKRPRIIPSVLAAGWVKNLLDHGRIAGLGPEAFYPIMFFDSVHPGKDGAYLVDMTWYAAFYSESPEGKVLPVGTSFNAEQAGAMQRLAWDVVKNYPDCGLYEEGSAPVGPPRFSPAAEKSADVTPVTLSSSTPGAWFRYTLDGTTPTRTRGYVYCGVISVRPGMTVKAVAYKSGMADSPVVESTFK